MEKYYTIEREGALENLEDKSKKITEIETSIEAQLPISSLNKIFPSESYLIGGSIRDVILQKSVKFSDLDIYTRCNQDQIAGILKSMGYSETLNLPVGERTYYFDEGGKYLYFILGEKKVDVKFIDTAKVEDLIASSDINLNCCAYDINKKCLVDDNITLSIKAKKLEFPNPEVARNDPHKVFSALKQIARFPDLEVPQETEEIIKSNIQKIFEYYIANPEKKQQLKKLLCEINSAQVLNYFNEEQKIIFAGLDQKPSKLKVPAGYSSYRLNELSSEELNIIQEFIKEKFGKRFDPIKLKSRKVNSVTLNKNKDGSIKSCCLFDGLRLYAIASSDIADIVKMVESIVRYNRSVWTTISADRKLLIKLSVDAGLQLENNKDVIHKILASQYSDYLNNIEFRGKNGQTTFVKAGSDNYEQVLLRS